MIIDVDSPSVVKLTFWGCSTLFMFIKEKAQNSKILKSRTSPSLRAPPALLSRVYPTLPTWPYGQTLTLQFLSVISVVVGLDNFLGSTHTFRLGHVHSHW